MDSFVLSLVVKAYGDDLPGLLSALKEVFFLGVFSAVDNARTVAHKQVSTGSSTVVLNSNVQMEGRE